MNQSDASIRNGAHCVPRTFVIEGAEPPIQFLLQNVNNGCARSLRKIAWDHPLVSEEIAKLFLLLTRHWGGSSGQIPFMMEWLLI